MDRLNSKPLLQGKLVEKSPYTEVAYALANTSNMRRQQRCQQARNIRYEQHVVRHVAPQTLLFGGIRVTG